MYLFYQLICLFIKSTCLWFFFLAGGLIDGIKKLVNAEGLVLDNISMDEGDAKKLGNFLYPILHHKQVNSAENVNF